MVHRRFGVVVVGLVTGGAGSTGQLVVAVDVALAALRCQVRAGQCPAGGGVVKLPVGPDHRVVAGFAGGREACGDMVHGGLGIVVVGQVAGDAVAAGEF